MDDRRFLPRQGLQDLLDALNQAGYRTLGPAVRDGAIQYLDLTDATQLPQGWTDDQAPGRYRLTRVDSPRCFAWATGPQTLKPLLFRSSEVLWHATREGDGGLAFTAPALDERPIALFGARACDLAALELQDRHFLSATPDPYYAARREGLLTVAVHCAYPADTCLCASTGDGPRATHGFDLALSELEDGYLLESGSERGAQIAARLPLQAASELQRREADEAIDEAARRQFRRLPSRNLRDALFSRLAHPRWDDVAARCLSCGNCTSVCPTCFCHAEHDAPELGGMASVHLREWDSCFSEGHGYLHGFNVRPDTRHRYRQWLTHKLGGWHDQYGRSGCVGCGRCITWCPVGIDITEEMQAICAGTTPEGGAP
jgi:ferredoxin